MRWYKFGFAMVYVWHLNISTLDKILFLKL